MPNLSLRRFGHSAAAFVVSSKLTEVVLFGGYNQVFNRLLDTTILRLGKFFFT